MGSLKEEKKPMLEKMFNLCSSFSKGYPPLEGPSLVVFLKRPGGVFLPALTFGINTSTSHSYLKCLL